MTDFKDFYQYSHAKTKKELVQGLNTIPIKLSTPLAIPILGSLFSQKNKEDEFKQEISDLSTSEPVIRELSNRLGTPKEGETEDDFVNRGKDILRDILRKVLDQK